MNGWFLTDIPGLARIAPQQDSFDGPQQLSINNVAARSILPLVYYWSAPSPYLGNKVSADGLCLGVNLPLLIANDVSKYFSSCHLWQRYLTNKIAPCEQLTQAYHKSS